MASLTTALAADPPPEVSWWPDARILAEMGYPDQVPSPPPKRHAFAATSARTMLRAVYAVARCERVRVTYEEAGETFGPLAAEASPPPPPTLAFAWTPGDAPADVLRVAKAIDDRDPNAFAVFDVVEVPGRVDVRQVRDRRHPLTEGLTLDLPVDLSGMLPASEALLAWADALGAASGRDVAFLSRYLLDNHEPVVVEPGPAREVLDHIVTQALPGTSWLVRHVTDTFVTVDLFYAPEKGRCPSDDVTTTW